jgi:hypothetical protein
MSSITDAARSKKLSIVLYECLPLVTGGRNEKTTLVEELRADLEESYVKVY